MAKKGTTKKPTIEMRPDAWARFERAVDIAVKSGPQHRTIKQKRSAGATVKRKGK